MKTSFSDKKKAAKLQNLGIISIAILLFELNNQ
jgi:hypothetical protein